MNKIAKIGLALGGSVLLGLGVYEGAKKGIIDGLDETPLYLREEKNDENESEEKEEK